MSKLSNTLLMLQLLHNGRKYSIRELARKIEVSERMIRKYKEELEYSGIFIVTIWWICIKQRIYLKKLNLEIK